MYGVIVQSRGELRFWCTAYFVNREHGIHGCHAAFGPIDADVGIGFGLVNWLGFSNG